MPSLPPAQPSSRPPGGIDRRGTPFNIEKYIVITRITSDPARPDLHGNRRIRL